MKKNNDFLPAYLALIQGKTPSGSVGLPASTRHTGRPYWAAEPADPVRRGR